jgi:hypothetical protein
VIQRHLFQEAERGAELVVNRRGGVIVQDLPDEVIVVEGRCRDRGMSVRSKVTLIQPRYKGGEELAVSDRPFGWAAHDRLRMRRVRLAEKLASIPQRTHDIRRAKAGNRANELVEQLV